MRTRPHADWLVLGWLVRRLLNEPESGSTPRGGQVASTLSATRSRTPRWWAGALMWSRPTPTSCSPAVLASEQVSALTCTGTSMTANVTEYLLWTLHVATDSL